MSAPLHNPAAGGLVAPPAVAPRRPARGVPNAVVGMLIFIATEAMFFSGLVSAFIITRVSFKIWPPMGQPRLPVAATAFTTTVLLASGVAMLAAGRTAGARSRSLVSLALALGTFFVVAQGYEWVKLLAYGLTLTSSPYGSFFYLVVGTHALHVAAAILTVAWARARLGGGTLSAGAFQAVRLFWYFVVGLWPILYVLVYLS